MVAPAHRCDRHVQIFRALDGLAHCKSAGDLSHRVAPVDDQRRAAIFNDDRLAERIHSLGGKLTHILGNSQNTVRMAAAQVGFDQCSCQQCGIPWCHTAMLEDLRDK